MKTDRFWAKVDMTHRIVAERFSMSRTLISLVVRGKRWAHV